MILRLIKESELNEILKLYNKVIDTSFCVWNKYYPSMDNIIEDYTNNNLYVLESDNNIIGAISVVTYNELEDFLNFNERENFIEIARVVIDPLYQGKGYAKIMVNKLIDIIKERKITSIHLSVYINHLPALNTYLALGFKIIDKVFMYENDYYLLELIIK